MKHLAPILLLIILVACPKPDEETICGQGMILSNDTCECIPNSHLSDDEESCECDSLYHWDDDYSACLLDTTSHDFVWELDTLGLLGSAVRDVCVVNENDITVVGAIWVPDPDSSYDGSGKEMFNSAHWDGENWLFDAIEVSFFENMVRPELYSILYFSDNDIWVTSLGFPIHWDGRMWQLYHLEQMGLNVTSGLDSWGNSPENIFFVGLDGGIVHYNGTYLDRMESNTKYHLYRVAGSENGEHVFACGWKIGSPMGSIALKLVDGNWETLYSTVNPMPIDNYGWVESVSVCEDTAYFSTQAGVWKYDIINDSSTLISNTNPEYSFLKRDFDNTICNTANDLFFIGLDFTLVHYNGVSWKFNDQFLQLFGTSNIITDGSGYLNNTLVIVGTGNRLGLVARGKRD